MVTLLVAAVVVVVLTYAFVHVMLGQEDFEREAKRPSLMRTGFQEFQGFLEPEKKAALEIVTEEKRKTDVTLSGDPPISGVVKR
ncbi:MAG: hypothetical protein DMG07_16115 [Acidobacteria bacterium]|nr:MAG: hypothetical protein DMG07_16115 [Acidobacteriota bacterium]